MKFTGSYAVSGDIALMKTEQLVVDHFNEAFAIRGLDLLLCKTVDVTNGLWLAHFLPNHGRAVRRPTGENSVIFNPNVLANPRNNCQLTYRLEGQEIVVEKQPGIPWVTVDVTALS
jgi:hypothetical protein